MIRTHDPCPICGEDRSVTGFKHARTCTGFPDVHSANAHNGTVYPTIHALFEHKNQLLEENKRLKEENKRLKTLLQLITEENNGQKVP